MTFHLFVVFKSEEGDSPFQALDFLHFRDLPQYEDYRGEREDLVTANHIIADLQGHVSTERYTSMMSDWLEKCSAFAQKWNNEKVTQDLRSCINEGRTLIGRQLLHFGASAPPNEHATVLATALNDVVTQTVDQSLNGENVQDVMDFLEGTIIMWPESASATVVGEYVANMVEKFLSAREFIANMGEQW